MARGHGCSSKDNKKKSKAKIYYLHIMETCHYCGVSDAYYKTEPQQYREDKQFKSKGAMLKYCEKNNIVLDDGGE